DQDAARERGVYGAEGEAEQPARTTDGGEDARVDEREEQPVGEVHGVADDGRLAPALGQRRTQEQRDLHAGQTRLLGEPEAAGEDAGPDCSAGERSPDARHSLLSSASAIVTAASRARDGSVPAGSCRETRRSRRRSL